MSKTQAYKQLKLAEDILEKQSEEKDFSLIIREGNNVTLTTVANKENNRKMLDFATRALGIK